MQEPELPGLVAAMAKFLERLESLDRKMDQVLDRVSILPHQASQASRPPHQGPVHALHAEIRKERVMYKAICADCCKTCEVPFKPTAARAVYCKECFAIRKAGHRTQDPDKVLPLQKKAVFVPSPMDYTPPPAVSKKRKQKPALKSRAKSRKK